MVCGCRKGDRPAAARPLCHSAYPDARRPGSRLPAPTKYGYSEGMVGSLARLANRRAAVGFFSFSPVRLGTRPLQVIQMLPLLPPSGTAANEPATRRLRGSARPRCVGLAAARRGPRGCRPVRTVWAALATLVLLSMPGHSLWAIAPDRPLTQSLQRIWQTQQGLPATPIMSILQTQDGYLWLGTQKGLFRFDGMHFTAP